MAERGWDAKGLLRPLWRKYNGGRDALALKVGTSPSVLSQINTGNRRLGQNLGGRIADELGVSLIELGAPLQTAAADEGQTIVDRIETLEDDVRSIGARLHELEKLRDTPEQVSKRVRGARVASEQSQAKRRRPRTDEGRR